VVEWRVRWACAAMCISFGIFVMACSGGDTSSDRPSSKASIDIVSTSSILGDWARQVGGDEVRVIDLIPPGVDPHTFQPSARDVANIAEADLVLYVGLNLEGGWLRDLIINADVENARVLALGPLVNTLESEGEVDPHFWMDPVRAKVAVSAIADELITLDAEHSAVYRGNAATYIEELELLDTWLVSKFGDLPIENRTLVTSHDSLGYFADRYDFRIVGAVIPGTTTERDPSASEMAGLIDAIRESQAKAIFTEVSANDRMARRISEETGVPVVDGLKVGTLGAVDSETGTYVAMMRRNVEIIMEALK
jgi:ABC-type Zn uptake system ZnuABC Zn-binding protein ZnuA